jgi:hypothetical protein
MAKKSRQVRTVPGRPTSAVPSRTAAQPVRTTRPIPAPEPRPPKEVDFGKEYHYVLEDLKRIGIIAAGLLVLLVVLALILV